MDLAEYIRIIDTKLGDLRANPATPPASPSLQHDHTPTQVRPLEDAGYTCEPDTTDGVWKDENTWLVSLPGAKSDSFIARLGVDVRQGMILVYEAWNKRQDTNRSMKLRDMIMSFWEFKAHQDIKTLRCIKYMHVVEEFMMPALDDICNNIFPGGQDDLYIPPTGGIAKMRKAYCKLMLYSPFAISAKNMMREYFEPKMRWVEGFIVSAADRGPLRNFTIYLGGSTNPHDDHSDAVTIYDGANNNNKEGLLNQYAGDDQGSLYNVLHRLRGNLSSHLLNRDWVLIDSEGLPDGSTLNEQGQTISPND